MIDTVGKMDIPEGFKLTIEQERNQKDDLLRNYRDSEALVRCHFHANPKLYRGLNGSVGFYSEEDRNSLFAEAKKFMISMGFTLDEDQSHCPSGKRKQGESIYMHPNTIALTIFENDLPNAIYAASCNDILSIWGCTVHEFTWKYSKQNIEDFFQLANARDFVKKSIFRNLRTRNRRTFAYSFSPAYEEIRHLLRVSKADFSDHFNLIESHVRSVLNELIEDGVVVTAEIGGRMCYRARGITELRPLEKKIVYARELIELSRQLKASYSY